MIKNNIKAFSLIELLVVISIIMIIISIISFTVRGAMLKTQTARCHDNLKQLHQCVIAFLGEKNRVPEDIDSDFLEKWAGVSLEKIKCPFVPEGILGYKINHNLVADADGSLETPLENMRSDNILIYETDEDGGCNANIAKSKRHGGICYGITIFGDITELKNEGSDDELGYKT